MTQQNLHFFYGEDTYSSWHKSQFWSQEFQKKYGDFNVLTFEGDNMTAADFKEAIQSMPFLGDKKFILVRDFLQNGDIEEQKSVAEKLTQQPESIPDFSVVLFVEKEKPDARTVLFKTLKKIANIKTFEPIVGPQLSAWIQQKVQERGGQISMREATLLAETVGPNLWQMTQEIEKLTIYAAGKPIPTEAIENMTSPNLATTIFKLTDHLGVRNAKAALKTLNTLLESGEEMVGTLFMIVRHFRILIQIQACLEQKIDKSAIAQKLKLHPYVISTALGQSKNFNAALLQKTYAALLAIDTGMKSGKIRMTTGDDTEMRLALEKLIVEICS